MTIPTTVLGSGTVVPDPDRFCASYYVETGEARVLLDCGPGAVHRLARFGLPWSDLTLVALSHFHTDHIGGLPLLLFSMKHALAEPRVRPLRVIGPAGTGELLRRLAGAFGEYMTDPGFPVQVEEVGHNGVVTLDADASLRAHPTPHTDASVAYRVESDGRALGYTGDTGFASQLARFLAGVDVLISECSLPDDTALETHLTPSGVAALARLAGPYELVLSHVFPQLGVERALEAVRQAGWDGALRAARDGLRLDVP